MSSIIIYSFFKVFSDQLLNVSFLKIRFLYHTELRDWFFKNCCKNKIQFFRISKYQVITFLA